MSCPKSCRASSFIGLGLCGVDQAAITVGQGISGIPERLLLIEVQGWFVALGWLGYRRATPPSR
ncbi:MAG TPA: hypothetical protein VF086_03165 [Propionibacteriaceae bacterium]